MLFLQSQDKKHEYFILKILTTNNYQFANFLKPAKLAWGQLDWRDRIRHFIKATFIFAFFDDVLCEINTGIFSLDLKSRTFRSIDTRETETNLIFAGQESNII
jgi:hypothetical protein